MITNLAALAVAAGAVYALAANYPKTHMWAGASEPAGDGTWIQSYTFTSPWPIHPWFRGERTVWYKNQRMSTLFDDPRRDLYYDVANGPLPHSLVARLFWRVPEARSGNLVGGGRDA